MLLSLTEFFDKVNCLRMNLSTLLTIKIFSQRLSTFRPRTAKRDQKTYYTAEIESACRKLPLGLKIPWETCPGKSKVTWVLSPKLSQRLEFSCPRDFCLGNVPAIFVQVPSVPRIRVSWPMGLKIPVFVSRDSKRIGFQSHFPFLFIFLIIK